MIPRPRLMEVGWGHERDVESNTLDVFMRQLRTKVEPPGASKLPTNANAINADLPDIDRSPLKGINHPARSPFLVSDQREALMGARERASWT